MRLPDNASNVALALGLSVLLAACGGGLGGQRLVGAGSVAANPYGPEADYPQVLGDPYTVDGETYTPEDVYSYDTVGFASVDTEGGQGVSVAHKTLPVPSYVEITSLESGKTILARIERRGPMTSKRLIALSPDAVAQLGIGEGEAVRVRRTNPPEAERAELRAGGSVAERLTTPESLLAVLKRKLPTSGDSASLAAAASTVASPVARPNVPSTIAAVPVAPSAAKSKEEMAGVAAAPVTETVAKAFTGNPRTNTAYPLAALSDSRDASKAADLTVASASGAQPSLPADNISEKQLTSATATGDGRYLIQAAAFESKANAQRLAGELDGAFVTQAGRFYRVRVGPYATRGQAEAALAKVRAAGYSDAKVVSAG